jgi:hypothetical protein
MASAARAFNPRRIFEGAADDVVQEVTGTTEPSRYYIVITMPDENSARSYAEILRDFAQLLPPALENAQKARIEQIIDALSANTIPPAPSGALAEARMMAEARTQVLKSGQFVTAAEIAGLAGYSKSNPSAQPARWKQDGVIFAIRHKGTHYFPRFALNPDDNYRPYKVVGEILRILRESSLSDWGIASWFLAVNSFLDDRAPKDLLVTDPNRVVDAARDEVSDVIHG